MKSGNLILIACVGAGGALAQSMTQGCGNITDDGGPPCDPGYYCILDGYVNGDPIVQCLPSTTAPPATVVSPYGQCGGVGYTGPTKCVFGYTCVRDNDYFSQCFQKAVSTTSTTALSSSGSAAVSSGGAPVITSPAALPDRRRKTRSAGEAAASSASSSSTTTTSLSPDCVGILGQYDECGEGYYCYIGTYDGTPEYLCALISTPPPATAVAQYGQCGGIGYVGLTNCSPGLTCLRDNDYFSQCEVATSTPTTSASNVPALTTTTTMTPVVVTSSAVLPARKRSVGDAAAESSSDVSSSSTTITATSLSSECSGIPGVSDEWCGEGYYCYIGYYETTPIYDCALISTPPPPTAVSPYGQCGGIGYVGLTNCISGYSCVRDNDYFSQCFQVAASTTSTPVSSSAPSTPTPTSSTTAPYYVAMARKRSASGESTSSASASASTTTSLSRSCPPGAAPDTSGFTCPSGYYCVAGVYGGQAEYNCLLATTYTATPTATATSKCDLHYLGYPWVGASECEPGYYCMPYVQDGGYIIICYPDPVSTVSTSTTTVLVAEYSQCGGLGFAGPTVCSPGLTCSRDNDYFSQCLVSPSTVAPSSEGPVTSSFVTVIIATTA